jgi:hypothetical protein
VSELEKYLNFETWSTHKKRFPPTSKLKSLPPVHLKVTVSELEKYLNFETWSTTGIKNKKRFPPTSKLKSLPPVHLKVTVAELEKYLNFEIIMVHTKNKKKISPNFEVDTRVEISR